MNQNISDLPKIPVASGGYLLLAALLLLAVVATLGVVLGRFLISDTRAFNEHILGSRLFAHAAAGMETAAWDLRRSGCDPATLPGVVVGAGGFTLQRQLVENGRVLGLVQNTFTPAGGAGRFAVTSTASTIPQSAYQRTHAAVGVCYSSNADGNLFVGGNATAWEQTSLVNATDKEAALVGYAMGDAAAQLAAMSCSASADNTTCLDLKRPLVLPASGGREVYFTARFPTGAPMGGFFSMTIDYQDALGGSAKVVCATADANEGLGVLLDEDGTIVCTHTPSYEVIPSLYARDQGGLLIGLGKNLDPSRVTAMRVRATYLPEGEELRLQGGCLGPDCSLDMNSSSVLWESGTRQEVR